MQFLHFRSKGNYIAATRYNLQEQFLEINIAFPKKKSANRLILET